MAQLSTDYLLSQVGSIHPATRDKAVEIIKAAQAKGHYIRFVWGMGTSSEHATGLALDIMVNDEAAGDFVRNYVWANRKRLRLRHVIWEQHITSTVTVPGVRRKMADRGSPTENHYDHNHIMFNDRSPYVPPKGASGPEVGDFPSPRPKPSKTGSYRVRTIRPNQHGRDVTRLQWGLKRVFPSYAGKLVADGKYGPKSQAAVKEFQKRSSLTPDGVVGVKTRAALRKRGIRL